MTFRFTPAGNWDVTDEVIPSSTLIKPLWRWVELVAPIASRLNLVPQSYVTHGGAAAGQLHLFQKRVLSYRVMLATKWRLPPRIETSAQRAPRRPESVKGPGGRSTRPDNTRPAGQAFLTEMSKARRGSKIDWTSAAKDALLWVPAGGHGHPVKHLGLASRCAGLWVVRASIPAPQTNGAQTMSTLSIKSRNTKSAAPKKGSAQSKTASRRKVTSPAANAKKPTRSVESKAERVAAATTPLKADEPRAERVTKQERVLTLLSQSEGASIEEMMQATDWQQHSVRGFLAGTVKRKLGFSLTSVKPNDGVRRYRIETRRVR